MYPIFLWSFYKYNDMKQTFLVSEYEIIQSYLTANQFRHVDSVSIQRTKKNLEMKV